VLVSGSGVREAGGENRVPARVSAEDAAAGVDFRGEEAGRGRHPRVPVAQGRRGRRHPRRQRPGGTLALGRRLPQGQQGRARRHRRRLQGPRLCRHQTRHQLRHARRRRKLRSVFCSSFTGVLIASLRV
jgi:hypothetical protein